MSARVQRMRRVFHPKQRLPQTAVRRLRLGIGLLIACLLASCAPLSTRPVVKLGLVAPFEGLYRRTGYTALAAMRLAIDEQQELATAVGVEFLPLALNDTNLPKHAQRSVQKLLLDSSVRAIIGPVTPATAHAAAPSILEDDILWMLPFAPSEPSTPHSQPLVTEDATWAMELLAAIGEAAQAQGAQRMVVAGWTPGWPARGAQTWRDLLQMPVLLHDDPDVVQATDAVLWLGRAGDGAAYYAQLRRDHDDVPFWMGPEGGDPVFGERAGSPHHVYWATWLDSGYEEWAQSAQLPASAYLVYRATQRAIEVICAEHAEQAAQPGFRSDVEDQWNDWRVFFFAIQTDGVSSSLTEASFSE